MVEWLVPTVVMALVPAVGWITNKVVEADKKQAAHEAADAATFESIKTTLADLKQGQTEQSHKLDRIVEISFRDASQVDLTQSVVETFRQALKARLD